MSGMNMTTESLTSPEPLPASPASKALDKAIDKKKLKLLDKRLSIGKTKLGHTYYKSVERSFKPPAGNVINLQHEQYALTYGMMCGIRDSAGLQKPFKQRLAMDDFMLVDRKIFPANSQLQHPFKFKDYSPDVFRQVRRRFGIDLAEYMLTLSGDFNFIEFMSNSKSGQFFFYSHDGRYMIKTQTKDESKFLRRILPHYYKFVMENPNTLITRFYGMHRVKMHHLRRKMHFVIMASVFHTPLEIHGRFDLKGSRIGRHASPAEHARGGAGVLKDMDLLEKGFHLQLGVARRAIFLVQLRKDVEFLKRMKIMDYSLLIGVHDSSDDLNNDFYAGSPIASGAESLTPPSDSEISRSMPSSPTHSDLNFPTYSHTRAARSASVPEYNLSNLNNVNLRSTCPAAIPPSLQSRLALSPPSTPTWSDGAPDFDSDNDSELDDSTSSEGGFFGTAFGDTSLAERCSGSLPSTPRGAAMPPLSPRLLDTTAYAEFSESIFCKDDGGIYGRDRHGRKNGFVYFLGIIDILQQYNTRKIAETFFKGLRHNRKQISAVNPDFYGDRFIEFMEKHVVQDDTLPLPSPRPLPSPSTRDAAVIDTMTRMEEEAAC
ncbi:hypothetical protein PHYBOEH_004350 [Phytophthora boehmeriae]|uniref:PIPK domain-containing protein n=1 Tax=Phytophthora boehmeriae TaxID=109152 RepID=A0A8T1WT28_9STRA|nr:hypothetical protein PHYBOEH_004350 [Phytophthora boehmeriae]